MKRIFVCILLISFVLTLKNKAFSKGGFGKINTVVIDAGHGGKDQGCSGSFSREKDVVLKISLKLGKLIEENVKGVKVVYTRTKDQFIELYKRAEIANNNKADLFICIHANANNKPQIYGTETYIMGLHKTQESLETQKRENQSILLEKDTETYKGFDLSSPEGNIIMRIYQNKFLEKSLDFAILIEKEFEARAKRKSRGVRQAGFIVLYKTSMPSVLIETGFLTNKQEEKFLMSDYGQDIIASAIYRAFKKYKKSKDSLYVSKLSKETKYKEIEKELKKNKDSVNNKNFLVQIATLKSNKKIGEELKKYNIEVISKYFKNKYVYFAGDGFDKAKAKKILEIVRNNGFKDAFLVNANKIKR